MKCPKCGLEMLLYETGAAGDEYVCRNPKCGSYDRRLDRSKKLTEKPEEKQA